jgi:hypothetical protein
MDGRSLIASHDALMIVDVVRRATGQQKETADQEQL